MIDLPAGWQEKVENIDWSSVQAAVQDYGPVLQVIRNTWDKESLLDISQGRLFVSDDVLNQAIADRIPADSSVKSVVVASHANGRMDVRAETEKIGLVELSGEIQAFVHDKDQSYMVYRVRERNLPDHGLMSWVFSRISLSMAERLVGHIELSDDLPIEIQHNTVRIDYRKVLDESDFGKTEFRGYRLSDMIEIDKATPKDGGIEFETKLNVPDEVKDALVQLVSAKAAE